MKLRNKREVPLRALQAMESFLHYDKGGFPQTVTADSYCLITDPNPISDFYFKVHDVGIDASGNISVAITRKPYSVNRTGEMAHTIPEPSLVGTFNDWVALVKAYEETWNIQEEEETIISGYREEFYDSFELVDKDADTHSYTLPVQLLLDSYLEKLTPRLESYIKDNDLSEAKKAEVESIIDEVNDLREIQTGLTKRKTLEKLSTIWAHMRKAGLRLLEEAKTELMKEAIKKVVKGLLENPGATIDFLNGML